MPPAEVFGVIETALRAHFAKEIPAQIKGPPMWPEGLKSPSDWVDLVVVVVSRARSIVGRWTIVLRARSIVGRWTIVSPRRNVVSRGRSIEPRAWCAAKAVA